METRPVRKKTKRMIEEDPPPSQKSQNKTLKSKAKKALKKVFTLYKCNACHKEFNNKGDLRTHTQTHAVSLPYGCDVCPFRCKVRKYLARHKRRVHGSGPRIACDICGKLFHFNTSLRQHMHVHTGEKPYACTLCGKSFSASYSLNTHMLIHSNEKPFQCKFCTYACRDSSTLRKHQKRHMGLESVYQCKMCPQKYKDKWRLKCHFAETHLCVDIRKFPCDVCGKKFKEKAVLTNHIQAVHERSKTGKCEICGAVLSNKSNLANHMLIHVDARPYNCTHAGCDKNYKDSSSLRKHMVTHYPNQQHPCEICGALFSRRERLEKHLKQHMSRKKRLQCDDCGARFYNKSYIAKHIADKHMGRRPQLECDMCGFITHNKPGLVMHIKYGHVSENDLQCGICKTRYKKHAYLKAHYARTHGIRYKVKTIKPSVDVKMEPLDEMSIDLLEIEKEELFEEPDEPQEPKDETDNDLEADINDPENDSEFANREDDLMKNSEQARVDDLIPENIKDMIIGNSQQLNKIPETVFDEHCIERLNDVHDIERRPTEHIDRKSQQYARQCVAKLLIRVRQDNEAKVLERTRRVYNRRMRNALGGVLKKDNIEIKYFNNNKINKNTNENISDDEASNIENDDNVSSDKVITDKTTSEDTSLSKTDDNLSNDKDISNNTTNEHICSDNDASTDKNVNLKDDKLSNKDFDKESNEGSDPDDSDYEEPKIKSNNKKVKFNTHQCYICFKLFETKEKLIDHCKDHFDVCTNVSLKKCPLCEYVTKGPIKRHLKLVHKVDIKVPYGTIKDRLHNNNGSRYFYEINDVKSKIKHMEVIPSVRNLNKIASTNIDKKNRKLNDKLVAKTKLVRKGKEWIVEREEVDVKNEFIIPKLTEDDFKISERTLKKPGVKFSNNYTDRLKRLYKIAKTKGQKMLFPCESCEKVCLTLAALKLHVRRHDENPKPFKPKVWKHKLNKITNDRGNRRKKATVNEVAGIDDTDNLDTSNRTAKPKPIKNKHKCDPELKEFYEKNIRGADIEFWQFLKIFNKLHRENVEDFDQLESRSDFGLHNIDITTKEVPEKVVKKRVKRRNVAFKRVIRISKSEHMRRNAIKNKLREEISKRNGG